MRVLGTKDQERASLRKRGLLGPGVMGWSPTASGSLRVQALPQPGGLWICPTGLVPQGVARTPAILPFLATALFLPMQPTVPGFGGSADCACGHLKSPVFVPRGESWDAPGDLSSSAAPELCSQLLWKARTGGVTQTSPVLVLWLPP